jgi:hypothetical protein
MIEKNLRTEADLQSFLVSVEEATTRGDNEIVAKAVAPKGGPLSQNGGWTEEGVRVARVLDQRILPVFRRTRYRWVRSSTASPVGITWVFRLSAKEY